MASHAPRVVVRAERAGDSAVIRAVTDAAFAPDATVGPLVEAVRASNRFVPALSLVARDTEGLVVGHVMLSHVDVEGDDGVRREVLTLSPLSVLPSRQGAGVGSVLVRTVLERAGELLEPLVVLEGSPAYYPRFGFVPARELGIKISLPAWAPPDAAMAMLLSGSAGEITGTVCYPPAFDDVAH